MHNVAGKKKRAAAEAEFLVGDNSNAIDVESESESDDDDVEVDDVEPTVAAELDSRAAAVRAPRLSPVYVMSSEIRYFPTSGSLLAAEVIRSPSVESPSVDVESKDKSLSVESDQVDSAAAVVAPRTSSPEYQVSSEFRVIPTSRSLMEADFVSFSSIVSTDVTSEETADSEPAVDSEPDQVIGDDDVVAPRTPSPDYEVSSEFRVFPTSRSLMEADFVSFPSVGSTVVTSEKTADSEPAADSESTADQSQSPAGVGERRDETQSVAVYVDSVVDSVASAVSPSSADTLSRWPVGSSGTPTSSDDSEWTVRELSSPSEERLISVVSGDHVLLPYVTLKHGWGRSQGGYGGEHVNLSLAMKSGPPFRSRLVLRANFRCRVLRVRFYQHAKITRWQYCTAENFYVYAIYMLMR